MRTRRIGELPVSVVGLGCNNFGRRVDEEDSRAVVDAALGAGVTLFDTADVYGDGASERLLGRALAGRRDRAVIATKFGAGEAAGASPSYVRRAVEASLRRLDVDVIDLYQLHTPDPDTPIEETLGALGELVEQGLVREIGHSNFDAEQMWEADQVATERGGPRFVSAQNRWSLLSRGFEREGGAAVADDLGLAVLPYFPLESGLLTGKYLDDRRPEGARLTVMDDERRAEWLSDERVRMTAELDDFARDHGRSLLDLAMSWLASHELVASVIAGATRPEQVRANARAATWRLSPAELDEIDRLVGGAV